MKAIKFRIWNGKEFLYWGFGEMGFSAPPVSNNMSIFEAQKKSEQFTGKQDKNGKEIYKGDKVYAHRNKKTYIVKHGLYLNCDIEAREEKHNCYGWYIQDEELGCFESLTYSDLYLEVIGNIHESKN